MNRWILPGLLGLAALGLTGCTEDLPTAVTEDVFPINPRTVEILLGWDEFAESLGVYGGYGTVPELGRTIVAHRHQGALDARALVKFRFLPASPSLPDSSGTRRADPDRRYVGGRIVLRLDTLAGGLERPITFSLHRPLQDWDTRSTNWDLAVDTVGHTEPWGEPGGGPAVEIGTGTWIPGDSVVGDSVVIEVDSASVALWDDTTQFVRGVRIDAETEGTRVALAEVALRLDARPSFNPDTVVAVPASVLLSTFIYTPRLDAPDDELWVGGVPAWRSVIAMDLPDAVTGPPSFCERHGCPFALDPSRINAALLVLRTVPSPSGFQPTDTVRLDARSVLRAERLPRSPLGPSMVLGGFGLALGSDAFSEDPGQEVGLDVTAFVQDLLRDTTFAGQPAPDHLALLSAFEPLSLAVAAFAGPEAEGAPYLRILVTSSDTVEIR